VSNGSQLTILTRRGSGHASVLAVAVSPHGLLAAGYAAAGLCLWEIGRRRPISTWARNDPGGVLAAAFSPDSQTLATGHSHNAAWIWDLATGHRIAITTKASPDRPGT
jgi:WD40 repeat protein